MKRTGKIAFCGMMCALSLVAMLLTVFPYGTYGLPALAGALLIPVALEAGTKWGFASYAAVALLSFLLAPRMEEKILFIAFFGYYPILGMALSRMKNQILSWGVKLLVFNVTMVGAYLLLINVVGMEADAFQLFGVNLPLVFLAVGNVVFVIYDIALCQAAATYRVRLHPVLCRIFRR